MFPKQVGESGLNKSDFLAFVVRFRPSANSMDGMANHIDESIVTFSISYFFLFFLLMLIFK